MPCILLVMSEEKKGRAEQPFLMFSTGCVSDEERGTAYFLNSACGLDPSALREHYTSPMMRAITRPGQRDKPIMVYLGEDCVGCARFVQSSFQSPADTKKMESVILGGIPVSQLTQEQKETIQTQLARILEQEATAIKKDGDLKRKAWNQSATLESFLGGIMSAFPAKNLQETSRNWRDYVDVCNGKMPSGWHQL